MVKKKKARRLTKAGKLWEWSIRQDKFTAQEAAKTLDMAHDTVIHYLRYWNKSKAAEIIEKTPTRKGHPGRPENVWRMTTKEQPAIWVTPKTK